MADMNGLDRFDDKMDDAGQSMDRAAAMAEAFDRELRQMQTTMADTSREVGTLERGISRGLKKAIDGLVFDGDNLADALKTVGKSMLDAAYNAAVQPVTNHFGGLMAGGVESLIQGLLPFEKGAGFSQGRVMPFANGGVVNGPVGFPMRGGMGLMGEAGPEAIMPLTRGANGKLGVRAEGGGRPITVNMNISTPDVQGFKRSQSQIAAQLSRVMGQGARNR